MQLQKQFKHEQQKELRDSYNDQINRIKNEKKNERNEDKIFQQEQATFFNRFGNAALPQHKNFLGYLKDPNLKEDGAFEFREIKPYDQHTEVKSPTKKKPKIDNKIINDSYSNLNRFKIDLKGDAKEISNQNGEQQTESAIKHQQIYMGKNQDMKALASQDSPTYAPQPRKRSIYVQDTNINPSYENPSILNRFASPVYPVDYRPGNVGYGFGTGWGV